MGKQPRKPPLEKYSLMVPAELDALVTRAMEVTGLQKSDVVRNVLDSYIRCFLGEAEEDGRVSLLLVLQPQFARLLEDTAAAYNLSPEALAQLIIGEHLGAYVEEAAKRRKAMPGGGK